MSNVTSAIKLMVFLTRKEGMSQEEFESRLAGDHSSFMKKVPGLKQWYVNTAVHGEERAPYDAVTEFWFPDQATFDTAMASPEVAAALADGASFLSEGSPSMMLVREHRVIES